MALDIGLEPDLDVAIDWLNYWARGATVVLSCKYTDPTTGDQGAFETRAFNSPVDWAQVRKWIADRNGSKATRGWGNIYYSVNTVKAGTGDKKTSRDDIAAMVALHVDCDARPNEDQSEGVARIIKTLEGYTPPPSDIVMSGGGAQAFWRLASPIAVTSVEHAEELKLHNMHLEKVLEGDHCHNIDRVMRVPGTVNIPKADKIAKGRKPRVATVYRKSDATYALETFKKMPAPDVARTAKYEPGFKDNGAYEQAVSPTDQRLNTVDPKWIALGHTGHDPDGKYISAGKVDRSKRALAFTTALLRAGIDTQLIASILMDPTWVAGDCVRDKGGETRRQLKRLIQRAGKFVGEDMDKPVVLRRDKWTETSEKFRLRADKGDWAHLIHYNDQWYLYKLGCYWQIEEPTVRSAARRFLDSALIIVGEEDGKPKFDAFDPNNTEVNELLSSLRDNAHADRDALAPPCWLVDEPGPDPLECISCNNGILHVPTREMYEATSDYFTLTKSDVTFNPDAKCPLWLETLKQYWPDADAKEITLLQEIVGYLLTGDMTAQKLFFFLGPGRSGKGTISRIIEKLIGERNVASPSLASLGGSFGLQSLVGKTMALIGETAFGRSDDRTLVTNILKTISGCDGIDVNRKGIGFLIRHKFRIRFLMLCNEMPGFSDNSRALITRMIVLKFNISYEGKEDETLEDRLTEELDGIMTWALEGYDRLRKNRMRFTMPEASLESRENFGRLASPIRSFVDDTCDESSDAFVTEEALYTAYEKWCEGAGQRPVPKTKLVDGVVSGDPFKRKQMRKKLADGSRVRGVTGLALKDVYAKVAANRKATSVGNNDSKAHADLKIPF